MLASNQSLVLAIRNAAQYGDTDVYPIRLQRAA